MKEVDFDMLVMVMCLELDLNDLCVSEFETYKSFKSRSRHIREFQRDSLQCLDAVGGATGRASGL